MLTPAKGPVLFFCSLGLILLSCLLILRATLRSSIADGLDIGLVAAGPLVVAMFALFLSTLIALIERVGGKPFEPWDAMNFLLLLAAPVLASLVVVAVLFLPFLLSAIVRSSPLPL